MFLSKNLLGASTEDLGHANIRYTKAAYKSPTLVQSKVNFVTKTLITNIMMCMLQFP